jgi:hypothetical protein
MQYVQVGEKGKALNNLTADFNNLETSKANNTKVVVDAVLGNTGLKEMSGGRVKSAYPSFWAFETVSRGEATHESCDLHNDIFTENQPHKKLPDADLWQVSSDAKLEAKLMIVGTARKLAISLAIKSVAMLIAVTKLIRF